MNKNKLILIVLFVAILGFWGGVNLISGYIWGGEDTYQKGYPVWFKYGQDIGEQAGYDKGYSVGKKDGNATGQKEGFDKGKKEGASQGKGRGL